MKYAKEKQKHENVGGNTFSRNLTIAIWVFFGIFVTSASVALYYIRRDPEPNCGKTPINEGEQSSQLGCTSAQEEQVHRYEYSKADEHPISISSKPKKGKGPRLYSASQPKTLAKSINTANVQPTIDSGASLIPNVNPLPKLVAETLANRIGVGLLEDSADCKYEDFFLGCSAAGDQAMVWDVPANAPPVVAADGVVFANSEDGNLFSICTPGSIVAGISTPTPGPKVTKALYPDDPSNMHHSYIDNHTKIRILHGGAKEHHIHHLHAHQWVHTPDDDNLTYRDSRAISPGSSFTLEITYNGIGNRNKVVGDSIFHCHFYPHFAMGMWELWGSHDVFESGTALDANGRPAANPCALPDADNEGWQFPQSRILSLWGDVSANQQGAKTPDPLFLRANGTDCISYHHTNMVLLGPGTPHQTATKNSGYRNSQMMGISEHFEFEWKSLIQDPLVPHMDFLFQLSAAVNDQWNGAETLIEPWRDPLIVESSGERALRTVFTHDHFGPSVHQRNGRYAGLFTASTDWTRTNPRGNVRFETRRNGNQTLAEPRWSFTTDWKTPGSLNDFWEPVFHAATGDREYLREMAAFATIDTRDPRSEKQPDPGHAPLVTVESADRARLENENDRLTKENDRLTKENDCLNNKIVGLQGSHPPEWWIALLISLPSAIAALSAIILSWKLDRRQKMTTELEILKLKKELDIDKKHILLQ